MTAASRWVDRAACRGVDPETFHAKSAAGSQHAITTWCLSCPVRADCLADALDLPADQDYGVRGGTTRKQRLAYRKRPGLPTGRSESTVAALRQLLDTEQPNYRSTPLPAPRPRRRARKETTVQDPDMATVPAPQASTASQPAAPARSVADFLAWAEQHPQAAIRKHAERAREALAAIQQRYAADTELDQVQQEVERARKRLATLEARAKELGRPGAKAAPAPDYDRAAVRAWAKQHGVPCPEMGRVPKAVVAAWREANAA